MKQKIIDYIEELERKAQDIEKYFKLWHEEYHKNNKAIEFLNNECLYDEDLGYCDDLWCGRVQEIVNIFKGDDKE